jgi:hypothetical protein
MGVSQRTDEAGSDTHGSRSQEMVTAESLNFDVLQIIFAYLSVPDLASVSQVNRSFLAGVLPRLYRSIGFHLNQAKRYPRVGYRHSLPLVIVNSFQ